MANRRIEKKRANRPTPVKEETAKKNTVQPSSKKKDEPKEEIKAPEKLTFYTVSAMLFTLVSAAATLLGMIMWVKPGYYYADAYLREGYGYYGVDVFYEVTFADMISKRTNAMFIVIAALLVVITVLSVVMVARSNDASKKPIPVLSVICFVLAAATVALFFVGNKDLHDAISGTSVFEFVQSKKTYGVYFGTMTAVIANVVFALVQIVATVIGNNTYKKTGKAF